MWINPQFSADLFTFNKEILNGNFALRAVTKKSTSDTDSKSFRKKKKSKKYVRFAASKNIFCPVFL